MSQQPCEDEGCPNAGTPHVCIPRTQSEPAAAVTEKRETRRVTFFSDLTGKPCVIEPWAWEKIYDYIERLAVPPSEHPNAQPGIGALIASLRVFARDLNEAGDGEWRLVERAAAVLAAAGTESAAPPAIPFDQELLKRRIVYAFQEHWAPGADDYDTTVSCVALAVEDAIALAGSAVSAAPAMTSREWNRRAHVCGTCEVTFAPSSVAHVEHDCPGQPPEGKRWVTKYVLRSAPAVEGQAGG